MELDNIIIVSLHSPKEKIWGRLISLTEAGVTIQGIELNSFDDLLHQIVAAEPSLLPLTTVFYPMHRVERIALDEPAGEIPSLAQRFVKRVGISLLDYLQLPRA
ncbi:MAG: hypothetical protein HY648_08005 [Acidobacteria bacterium]|nr:hypothetical protein [Acidobacteriota bacterium]